MRGTPTVAVVGAGLTGLAAAYRLAERGAAVTLYEASDRVGGVVRSERHDGYLAEHAANSFAWPTGDAAALLESTGIATRAVRASAASRTRYIVRRGRLVPLPASPAGLLTTPLLSAAGKWRLLREPFVRGRREGTDESVAEFARRRLGREAADYLLEPFIGGVYAGNADGLSMRHALPRLYALERAHGSLLRGALAMTRRPRPARRGMWSFPDGLETLPRALADGLVERFGGELRLGAPVRRLSHRGAGSGQGWLVETDGGPRRVDAVVYAGTAHALDRLDVVGEDELRRVAEVPYAPVALLVLGFRREDVAHALDGAGFLAPALERRRVLGTLFSSTLFGGRAPADHVTLTTFVGGVREPRLARLDVHALTVLVLEELRELLGVRGEPTFRRHVAWPQAIPQFFPGYGRVHAALHRVEARHPGLFFAGTWRHGVAVGDALHSGCDAAGRVGRFLERAGPDACA